MIVVQKKTQTVCSDLCENYIHRDWIIGDICRAGKNEHLKMVPGPDCPLYESDGFELKRELSK